MKITERKLTAAAAEEREYRQVMQIDIDGVRAFHVSDGEPEDSNLSRDFSDCWGIVELMRKAFEAGKNGEEFIVEETEEEEL